MYKALIEAVVMNPRIYFLSKRKLRKYTRQYRSCYHKARTHGQGGASDPESKGAELGPMLLLTIGRAHILYPSHLDFTQTVNQLYIS